MIIHFVCFVNYVHNILFEGFSRAITRVHGEFREPALYSENVVGQRDGMGILTESISERQRG